MRKRGTTKKRNTWGTSFFFLLLSTITLRLHADTFRVNEKPLGGKKKTILGGNEFNNRIFLGIVFAQMQQGRTTTQVIPRNQACMRSRLFFSRNGFWGGEPGTKKKNPLSRIFCVCLRVILASAHDTR